MSAQALNIGVMGLPGGWSTELLLQAVRPRGARAEFLNPDHMELDLTLGRVLCQGQDLSRFDALIVKKLGQAYSPDLLDRLAMLRFLETGGTRVFSKAASMARLLNRLHCTVDLAAAGIPLPPTRICQTPEQGAEALRQLRPCVVKPLYTSKAKGMRLVQPGPQAVAQLRQYQEQGHAMLYLQSLLELPSHDLGVVFIGGQYLCTYARGARQFQTQAGGDPVGRRYFSYQPSPEVLALARRAETVFGLEFTCMDIVETSDGPVVLEVSAFGGFRGIWEAQGLNAAEVYVDHVLKVLES